MRQQQNLTPSASGPQSDERDAAGRIKGDRNTKRRIEINVEKHRVLTLSIRRISAVGWCPACGMKVRMVTAEDASRIALVTPRTIYRRAEAGQIHFTETQDGLLLICLRSLG